MSRKELKMMSGVPSRFTSATAGVIITWLYSGSTELPVHAHCSAGSK
jgi:hypothetical protein